MKFIQNNQVSVTSATARLVGTPGELRYDSDGKVYKCCLVVKSTLSRYLIAALDSVSGTDGYSIRPTAATSNMVVGINAFNQDVTTGSYLWVLQKGLISWSGTVTSSGRKLGEDIAAVLPCTASTGGLIRILDTNDLGVSFGHSISAMTSTQSGQYHFHINV